MNVGVIGYYGFGNAGDEVILESLKHFLAPHRVIAIPTQFPPSREAIERLNAFDFLILGGGGLFQRAPLSPFDTFDQWMDCLKAPIGVLGLGIERLDPPFLVATHKLVDKTRFFVVRDGESKRLIGHPQVQVAPDLTFYKPLRIAVSDRIGEKTICGVNLRPARPGVSEWIRAISDLPCQKRAIPLSIHPEMGDREALVAIDPGCPAQFSVSAYASLDLMVGTAFHSIVFAIQNGIPVIAINYNPKVRRFMEEIGLGGYVLEWNEWSKLGECYEKALANREVIRRRMLDYTAWAEAELRQVLQGVRRQIDDAERKSLWAASGVQADPKVSIIVLCQDTTEDDVSKTTFSCLNQTCRNLDVILVADFHQKEMVAKASRDDARVRLVVLDKETADWAAVGFELATGDYATWLHTAAWYADDAVSVLVNILEERPTVDLAYADFFVTHAGIIERKINTKKERASDLSNSFGPCFLVRREVVRRYRDGRVYVKDSGGKRHELGNNRTVHIPHGLFFRPATESEICLYRSAIAYGRSRIRDAKQFLARALGLDAQLLGLRKREVVDLFEAAAHEALIAPNPGEFVELVFQNLPEGADGLGWLKKKLLSRIAMARFFEAYRACNWRGVLRAAWPGIWNDPSWLHNRGVWGILLWALAATVLPGKAVQRRA